MKKKIFSIFLICLVLPCLLCSCSGRLYDAVCDVLGIDNKDYSNEEAIASVFDDEELVLKLSSMTDILCFGEDIITFDRFSDRSGEYVNTVLNYLAGTYYSRYSADKATMDKFSAAYPELSVNALIPLGDYENTVYSYFGGSKKAVVRSTAVYSYLDKIDAFLLVGYTPDYRIEHTVHELEETENTYRMTVTFIRNESNAGTYDVIFKKREGAEPYILKFSASSKIYSAS